MNYLKHFPHSRNTVFFGCMKSPASNDKLIWDIPEHGCLICVMSEQLSSYLKQKYTIFESKNIYHPLKDSQSVHFLCYAFSFKRQNSSVETHRHLKLSYQLIDRLQLEVGNKCYRNRSIMYYFDRTFLDTYEKYM